MSKKNHNPAPVPPANRPTDAHGDTQAHSSGVAKPAADGTGFQEEDPKRRLGDFTGKGEHSIQQPGGKNDANH